MEAEQERIRRIFFPALYQKQMLAQKNGAKFVHYTSAEAALNIIKTKQIWMRQATCMNDYSEILHGLDCLDKAFGNKGNSIGHNLVEELKKIDPEITTVAMQTFVHFKENLKNDTFFVCVSEHDPNTENDNGRLSMWRAYGGQSSVALVLNGAPFFSESDALRAYTSVVDYNDISGFEKNLSQITSDIKNNVDFLKSIDKKILVNTFFNFLLISALSIKHPGFLEEKEWRVFYTPTMSRSEYIKETTEVIKGVPQPICKIPLEDIPDEGLLGIEIPSLLDRIIIGPTEFPAAIKKAFISALIDANVSNPESKIVISNIPLRK